MKNLITALKTILAALLISHLPLDAHAAETIQLSGSSTVAPLMAEIAARYEKTHPGVRIDVQSGGSSKGVTDAREGAVDIGMASRALKTKETDLKNYVVALDGIAMITHKSNPVANLTKNQIIKIYRGELKNWKDLGGADTPIVVVNKAEGRSTLELFLHYTGLKNSEIKANTIIGENEQGIKFVSGNKNAIAYVSIGTSEVAAKNGTPIKMVGLEGVTPSTTAVKAGTYPMTRPLNLVTKSSAKLKAEVTNFLKYAQSKEVADIVTENAFVVHEK